MATPPVVLGEGSRGFVCLMRFVSVKEHAIGEEHTIYLHRSTALKAALVTTRTVGEPGTSVLALMVSKRSGIAVGGDFQLRMDIRKLEMLLTARIQP